MPKKNLELNFQNLTSLIRQIYIVTMNIGSSIETAIGYWTAINMSLGCGKYCFMLNWRRHLNLWNKIPFLCSCMANKNIEYSIMCINDLLCLCYLRTFGTLVSNNRLDLRPVLVSVVTNSILTFGPLIDFWRYTTLTPSF